MSRFHRKSQSGFSKYTQGHDKNTTKWSEALPFVQFTKNNAYHQGIKQTPYEAMFGNIAKRCLATSSLPREQIKDIETEEQLEKIIQSIDDDNTEQVEHNFKQNEVDHELKKKKNMIQNRAAARMGLELQAERMLRSSRQKCTPVKPGDTVRI
ncbi:hypothetical protein QTP88_014465 [Uroleucon formosanum]